MNRSDALAALDMALMGNFEARRDRLGFAADLSCLNVSADADTPFGGFFGTVSVGTKIIAFTAIAAYSVDRTDQWVDPIIVQQGKYDFAEKWFATFDLDVGDFDVSSESTHQAGLGSGNNLNESWSLLGGRRYLDLERENGANGLDFRQSGEVLGVSYSV